MVDFMLSKLSFVSYEIETTKIKLNPNTVALRLNIRLHCGNATVVRLKTHNCGNTVQQGCLRLGPYRLVSRFPSLVSVFHSCNKIFPPPEILGLQSAKGPPSMW